MKKFLKKYGLLIFAIIYFLSPFDLLPEFILPIVGYLDDAGITGAAILKMLYDQRKLKEEVESTNNSEGQKEA